LLKFKLERDVLGVSFNACCIGSVAWGYQHFLEVRKVEFDNSSDTE
jgi:hypothetical protein